MVFHPIDLKKSLRLIAARFSKSLFGVWKFDEKVFPVFDTEHY